MSDSSDDDTPISSLSSAKKTGSLGSSNTQAASISVDSSDDEIYGLHQTNTKKSTAAKQGKKKARPQHPPCEVCGKTDDKSKFVPCTCCNESGRHKYCFDDKRMAANPPQNWKCEHCRKMIKADPLVNQCALVSVVFEYYGTCIGEVQDVRYETISDDPPKPGPRGEKKEYLLV